MKGKKNFVPAQRIKEKKLENVEENSQGKIKNILTSDDEQDKSKSFYESNLSKKIHEVLKNNKKPQIVNVNVNKKTKEPVMKKNYIIQHSEKTLSNDSKGDRHNYQENKNNQNTLKSKSSINIYS